MFTAEARARRARRGAARSMLVDWGGGGRGAIYGLHGEIAGGRGDGVR